MTRKNGNSTYGHLERLGGSEHLTSLVAGVANGEPVSVETKIRIVIADDHPIFRDSLRVFLNLEDTLEVVGTASDGCEALSTIQRLKPDILLLDMCMPRMSGMEVLRELSLSDERPHVLVLTAAIDRGDTVQALQYGARGVVLKSSSSAMLIKAIEKVQLGEYWIGQEGVASLIDVLGNLSRQVRIAPGGPGLTQREGQIIDAVVAGYSNPQIAEHLAISEQTVKHHLTNVFDKLGVDNRLELALFAASHRLRDREDNWRHDGVVRGKERFRNRSEVFDAKA